MKFDSAVDAIFHCRKKLYALEGMATSMIDHVEHHHEYNKNQVDFVSFFRGMEVIFKELIEQLLDAEYLIDNDAKKAVSD